MLSRALLSVIVLAVCVPAIAGPREACDYSARSDGLTCLVMLGGSIVHEQYRQMGDEAERWRLASGTKSLSGVAAAAAVQDGLLRLDERVSDTLTE